MEPTFITVTSVHVFRRVSGCHCEDVSYLWVVGAAHGPQLQDVQLLHLQVLDRPAVLQQQTLALETLFAQFAVVTEILC